MADALGVHAGVFSLVNRIFGGFLILHFVIKCSGKSKTDGIASGFRRFLLTHKLLGNSISLQK